MTANDVVKELAKLKDPVKAGNLQWFFKTGPGEYGEGDVFWGLNVPDTRKVAKQFKDLSLEEISQLLDSEVHEQRQCGLFILVLRSKKNKEATVKEDFDFYLKKAREGRINNWDLVDASAPYIVGGHLADKEDRSILVDLAKSEDLWLQRISIISTLYFINRLQQFDDALEIGELLLDHEHDLIHKAVGWMLREIGNNDREVEEVFLRKHYKTMPRTMLRYAIEKFPEELRQDYLKGRI